jgi:phosphoribosylformylglycinamidine (FGAM) synthase-like enzyme
MNKQTQFFIDAWKHVAELDDFLAEQAAEAAQRITQRFELKLSVVATATDNFRLEVIVRKEPTTGKNVLLDLSLPAVSTTASREAYMETVRLLREATQEAMALPPVLTRTVVRFRWTMKYRYPLHAME